MLVSSTTWRCQTLKNRLENVSLFHVLWNILKREELSISCCNAKQAHLSIPRITLHLLIIQLDFKLNLRKHRDPHVCTHTKLLFLVALRHRNLLKQFRRQKMPELGSMFKLHSMMSGVSSCFSDITGDECSKRELIQGTGQCNASAIRAPS